MLKLASTYELPDLHGKGSDSELRFVVEILQDLATDEFLARLSRREFLRVTPSSATTEQADEEILVEDSFWPVYERRFASEKDALVAVLSAIENQLGCEELKEQIALLGRKH